MGESRDEYIHCIDPPISFTRCEFPPFDSDLGLGACVFCNSGGHEEVDKQNTSDTEKGTHR